MKDHILEFSKPGTKISKRRGLLSIRTDEAEAEIPLDDIFGMLILSEDIWVSTNALTSLIERGIAVQFCDQKYLPCGILTPYVGHHLTRSRQLAQQALSEIQRGRLWQRIVIQKIKNQGRLLELHGESAETLQKFSREVESNDATNLEAQAARIYWRKLFGEDFKRDLNGAGVNSFLNYGYAIVRSAVARSTVSCGLNPSFGLFHSSMENPFCLIDDLMEPFRPLVDEVCAKVQEKTELSPEIKRLLVAILESQVAYRKERKPLRHAIHEYCRSFTNAVLASDWKRFDSDVTFINAKN